MAPVDCDTAGSARYTPRPISPNAIKKPKGLHGSITRSALDAGMARYLHPGYHVPGASESDC
jgi:hypothetical protein